MPRASCASNRPRVAPSTTVLRSYTITDLVRGGLTRGIAWAKLTLRVEHYETQSEGKNIMTIRKMRFAATLLTMWFAAGTASANFVLSKGLSSNTNGQVTASYGNAA